jgi:hypothetical protein
MAQYMLLQLEHQRRHVLVPDLLATVQVPPREADEQRQDDQEDDSGNHQRHPRRV